MALGLGVPKDNAEEVRWYRLSAEQWHPNAQLAGYDHHDYADEIREALERWAERLEHIAMPEGVRALR